jgi:cobalt-zinc-cadmium efflux system protein
MTLEDHHHRHGHDGLRQLLTALGLTAGMMVLELLAALLSGSLALMADAGHMLTDASALGLSFFASWIATKPANEGKTFGYYRTEILAALVNGIALWLLVIFVSLSALRRLHDPSPVQTWPMLIAAALGLIVNLMNSRILRHAAGANLNVQSARLHVISDALGSLAVIVAGVAIHLKGWTWADPAASLVIACLVAASSWKLVAQSVNILLEGAPSHLNVGELTAAMGRVPGVCHVHDVHVWAISTGLEAMSGHVVVDDRVDGPETIAALNAVLHRFGIRHTTLQLEPKHRPCELTQPHARGAGD